MFGENVTKVLCAAISFLVPDDGSSVIICGRRHWDDIMHSQVSCFDDELWRMLKVNAVQGFIDTDGKFLTREEAFVVAKENNQIVHECGTEHTGKLYSENLY